MFFPTPYAASDLYTKTQIDNQLTSIKTDVGACVKYTDIGKAGGVAGLDINKKVPTDNLPDSLVYTGSDGKISASVLPSYVDDVKEIGSILNTTPTVYGGGDYTVTKASEIVCTPAGKLIAYNAVSGYFKSWTSTDPLLTMEAYGTSTTSGVTPATDKIYVTLNDNRVYRYSGSVLVEISSGALSDAEASTLLNQYIKTITNGTVTPVYNAAEIEVVTGAGTKTNSTSKEGAIQTLTKSKAATKTYVDRMSPEVTIEDPVDADSNVADYVYNVGYTEGSI